MFSSKLLCQNKRFTQKINSVVITGLTGYKLLVSEVVLNGILKNQKILEIFKRNSGILMRFLLQLILGYLTFNGLIFASRFPRLQCISLIEEMNEKHEVADIHENGDKCVHVRLVAVETLGLIIHHISSHGHSQSPFGQSAELLSPC